MGDDTRGEGGSAPWHRPFEPLAYHVETHKGAGDEGSRSLATAEVSVGGEVLRGEAVGGGPIDALDKALRRALIPAYPNLDRVDLVALEATIAHGHEGAKGSVEVRVTGGAPGSQPWTTVASAGDVLHAAWLAISENLEVAIVRRAGITGAIGEMLKPGRAMPLVELAATLKPAMDAADSEVLRRIAATDWAHTVLDIDDAGDRAFVARAAALGAAVFLQLRQFCRGRGRAACAGRGQGEPDQGAAGESGRQHHHDARALRRAIRLVAGAGGARQGPGEGADG